MKTPEQLRNDFWNEDKRQGGVIRSQYDQIKEILSTRDAQWVNDQLIRLKEHAIRNVPFYKDYSVDDVFPVMNKILLLEHYEQHKAGSGFDLPLHISSTSGSTGTPFAVLQDYKKRMRNIADLKVFGERCDYPSHERMVYFREMTVNRPPEQEQRENIYYIQGSDLSDSGLERMRKVILEMKPRTIFSYSSTLHELAKYIYDNKLFDDYGLTSVLSGGEALPEEARRLLEEIFHCKVYRRYSDMELGIFGQDMSNGSSYEMNWGSYHFECLKLDRDEPAENGKVGRIVVTDLFNYAFPMIRYDTGDLGIMTQVPGSFPVFTEIYGRRWDCIYATDGSLISPFRFWAFMREFKEIRQWQFIQNDWDQYVLRLNPVSQIDPGEILRLFKKSVGDNADIKIEYVDEIPVLSSNKRRYVICNYKK